MWWLGMLVSAICLGFGLAGLRHLSQDSVITVHRFGRYRRTLGPGWRWVVPGLDRLGSEVSLIGHHLHVPDSQACGEAELYYQILDPDKAGEALNNVDAWVAAQTRDALSQGKVTSDQLKLEINRRIGALGLRVVRCSLHIA